MVAMPQQQQRRVSTGFAPDFMVPVISRMGEGDLATLAEARGLPHCVDVDEGIDSCSMAELSQSMLEPMVKFCIKKDTENPARVRVPDEIRVGPLLEDHHYLLLPPADGDDEDAEVRVVTAITEERAQELEVEYGCRRINDVVHLGRTSDVPWARRRKRRREAESTTPTPPRFVEETPPPPPLAAPRTPRRLVASPRQPQRQQPPLPLPELMDCALPVDETAPAPGLPKEVPTFAQYKDLTIAAGVVAI